MFRCYLRDQGLEGHGEQILDVTLRYVLKWQNIKNIHQSGSSKKLYSRWVKQIDMNHYDYKIGVCIDTENGFIRRFVVTPANDHDYYVWAD